MTFSFWRVLFLAGLSGVLLHLAFPPWNFEVLVWVWLLPLLSILWPLREHHAAPRRPFWIGWWAGWCFFLPNVSWVRHSARVIHGAEDHQWIGWGPELLGAAAVVGLAGYLSLYFALWAWFVCRHARPREDRFSRGTSWASAIESLRCAALAGAAWVACEWLRGWMLSGFGWNGLGVGLHRNLALIQVVDWVGIAGLSFLPVFIACVAWNNVVRLVRHWGGASIQRSRLDFTVAMIVLLGVAVYGMFRMANEREISDTISVRTLLVQPNVGQVERWSGNDILGLYQQLSDRTRLYAEARNGKSPFDLVVWPESAVPVPLNLNEDDENFHRQFFDDLLGTGRFAVLTGAVTDASGDQMHNSALLLDGGYENRQESPKIHLVPFGEFLPFRSQLVFMEAIFGAILPGDFAPGSSYEPMILRTAAEPVDLIPLVCFEDTVGRFARRLVRPRPQILANLTNDGWFLQSAETEIHLINSIFRAVELRRPMLRAANTGVSCLIDTTGRITQRLADPVTKNSFIEGCLPGVIEVSRAGEMTFYARFGDVFAWLCFGLTVGTVVVGKLRKRRKN